MATGLQKRHSKAAKEAPVPADTKKDARKRLLPQRSLTTKLITAGLLLCVAAALTSYQYLPHYVPAWMRLSKTAQSKIRDLEKIQHPERRGNKSYRPSFGIFPQGCKWREVHTDNSTTVTYQYWDAAARRWHDEMPLACTVQGIHAPAKWRFHKGSPRTEVLPRQAYVLYRNLWYNNGRWFALVDGPEHVPSWKFSRNQEIITLHVDNAAQFANSVKWRIVPGDTLLFDFIYFIHPTAIGHWWEMLGPLFSILKTVDFRRPCDQLILLHLRRNHFMEWVRAMLAVTLGVGVERDLPPVLMQQETENVFHQITQRLEGVEEGEWLVFERVLIVRDLSTGGTRTFHSQADATEFRAKIYAQYGLPPPAPRPEVPRVITFQRKRANRRVINEEALTELLRQYGELRVVEFNGSHSLLQQLRTMSDTGVYISVHTSNLANSPFLQPGSAVIEIIQRHWSWNGLDTSFKDQTGMMGDIHHFAWRALWNNQTVYLGHRDQEKFGSWTNNECFTEECVEAHTNVDVIVDIPQLKAILDSRLPLVFAGASVQEAAIPWPSAADEPPAPAVTAAAA